MNILLTGAGGPSAISVWKSLASDYAVHMVDMDACAAGLYLVPPERRAIVPRGDSPLLIGRLLELCRRWAIDVVIPTVDQELVPVADAIAAFKEIGVRCAVAPVDALHLCGDKHALIERLQTTVNVPRTTLLTDSPVDISRPLFVKPRRGAGSRGAAIVSRTEDLATLPRDGSYLIQEFLPGTEYSVDVYLTTAGLPLASVVRERLKIDSGIAVAARTVHLPDIAAVAITAAQTAGLYYVCNVQFRCDHAGTPRLLEINPRFPGTLPLTRLAGVDLPRILIAELAGEMLPDRKLEYDEIMAVRYLEEIVVPVDQWRSLTTQ